MTLGCENRAAPSKTKATGPRYLALGDSYTIGQSVEESERWPVQLVYKLREAHVEISGPQIVATTGWTTGDLSRAMDDADLQPPYALVSLLIGVNNHFQGRSIDEFREQFAALLKRAITLAGEKKNHVIVVSIPDWGVMPFAWNRDRTKIAAEIDRFNDVCRAECAEQQVTFIDITPISRRAADDPSLGAEDGLHPSGKQYAMWCDVILPAAKQALNQK